MTTKLTDEQVEVLGYAVTCPKCWAHMLFPARAYGGELELPANADMYCEAQDNDGKVCGWTGTIREAVESMLKRARIEVAASWHSDEPPEGTRVELRHRSGWIADGVFTTSYRNGDLHRMLNGVSLATDFENFKWRPAGPNPFDQK